MAGFDQFIDAVAFGQDKPQTGACLGLYLSPETIYVAETRLGKDGRLAVEHLVRIPVLQEGKAAGAGTMTMSTDFLTDPAKIGGLIRQSMAQTRWNSKSVVVTLSHHLGLLRYFSTPPMEKRFLKSAVPIEAKKYIPIPFDALAYDYQAAPMPPDASGKARLGVLIAVSQQKNLANISGLMQSLGLRLVGLEVAPCSVLRVWRAVQPPKGVEPSVQLHFNRGGVRILICDRGLPVFFREVFLGAEAAIADQRKVDLSGCLAFAQKQLGLGAAPKITLSGAPGDLRSWKEALSAETGLPAEIQDTSKLLSIKGEDWGGYAAIGASARALAPTAVTLDLAAVNRVSDDERQTARAILLAGALLTALIAGAGFLRMISSRSQARELASYAVDPEVKAALAGLPASAIEDKLKEMREQLDRLVPATDASRPRLSDILRDIVELMPENLWLSRISAINSLGGEKAGLDITLRGNARGASKSAEQEMAQQFRETLLRSVKLGKLFEVQIEVHSDPAAAEEATSAGLDPNALAQKLESRTAFTIELKAKRHGF